MGVAALAVETQLFANPAGAIAAGAALVVAGAVAKQVIKNMSAKKMEQGGLVYGNSFVNVGEYGNAHTNPEVIAPLSKLQDIIGKRGMTNVNVGGVISGNNIQVIGVKQGRSFNMITGRKSM